MSTTTTAFPLVVDCGVESVTITGLSGNSYVAAGRYGLESPTVASAENAPTEVPALWAQFKAQNPAESTFASQP